MDLFKKAKQRIFRGYFRLGAHIHVRHWRGHGIHSPFMYGIVRNVFMKSKITGPDTRLYDELRRERIGRKHAVKIQNLYAHCRMESHTLVTGLGSQTRAGRNLCILMPDASAETIVEKVRESAGKDDCLILLAPHRNARRWRMAQQIRTHMRLLRGAGRIIAVIHMQRTAVDIQQAVDRGLQKARIVGNDQKRTGKSLQKTG